MTKVTTVTTLRPTLGSFCFCYQVARDAVPAHLTLSPDCHGDGGAGGFGTGGRGLWASTATPRHCGYLLCLMPNLASQLPAISVACGPQLPSRTTKQSVYQASPGSHRQMGGTPTVAATRAWAGAVRAISLLFAFAPASGSASFGSAITSFAGVRWRLAERQDTPPARGTLRASSRKKSFHRVISGPDRHSAPVSGSATDRETKIWWFYVLINAHVSFLP